MGESATQWLSDGILNDQENLDLPLNYTNLSNEMIFILVFSMYVQLYLWHDGPAPILYLF